MKLINSNCIDALKEFESDSIDCIVTSPPYDDLRTYNDSSTWDFSVFKTIAPELVRVLRPNRCLVWIVNDATVDGDETGTSFKQALYFKKLGLKLHDTMIWNKNDAHNPSINRYYNCFEFMFVLSKGTPEVTNLLSDRKNKRFGDMVHGTIRTSEGTTVSKNAQRKVKEFGIRFNVWDVSSCKSNKERQNHPAPFPIKLAKDHILTWTKEGDVVLDPFMGSGSTGIACLKTGRNFIGIEIDKDYFTMAENRLKRFEDRFKDMKRLF